MSRAFRRIVPPVAAVLVAAACALPASSGAASSTTCKLTTKQSEHLGPTYVTYASGRPGFKVSGVSCAAGQKVIVAFHKCRFKHGKTGTCTSKVLGYSCREKRSNKEIVAGSLLSFEGDVTCKRGSASVVHHYQQNT